MIKNLFALGLLGTFVFSASAEDYKPELFSSIKPVYSDDFSSGEIDLDHWQIRQNSTWVVKEGVLTGSQSSKEFQEKRIAAGDKAHAGLKPVMWLEKVPENLVVHFRLRYDGKEYHRKFPLIDVGHHVNTIVFGKGKTTLNLKKNTKEIVIEKQFLPLNEWVDVTIELKKGAMLLKVGDKKHLFEDPLIDMVGQQQIDFKGLDFGETMIDDVEVFEGVE
ncbi:MAG: hypothetical protein CMO55_06955 [Verrucomicrobiales bacterium]|nr:hypothetical protein [Verrucomicrobiales bacterium]